MAQPYVFDVVDATVVDGDTYHLTCVVDVGFRITTHTTQSIRLDGWDCPETRSSASRKITEYERTEAKRATELARDWFATNIAYGVRVQTQPDTEKYGRWLGRVFTDRSSLGSTLGGERLATVWPTRWYQRHDQALSALTGCLT